MSCDPIGSALVTHVAVPPLSGCASQPAMVVPLSANATLPAGTPVEAVTVAVSVTDCVNSAGERLDATDVVVAPGGSTTCVIAPLQLARYETVPSNLARMEWLPGVSAAVANVAAWGMSPQSISRRFRVVE